MRITGEGEEFSILVLKSFSVDWIGSKRIGIPCLNDEDHRGEEEEFPILVRKLVRSWGVIVV